MYSEVKKASEKAGDGFSVSGVLKRLKVSKSGYYDWLRRDPSKREQKRLLVQRDIMDIYEESHQIYGAPKITEKLKADGQEISERTVSRYMKDMQIHAWYRRPYTATTISTDFTDRLKNILKREFSPERPNAVWCTDITYIHTKRGFLYLSCIMDLYSRKIIAWELGRTLETEYVIRAVNKAIEKTGCKPRVIHTDRGVQYTSGAYAEITADMERSYSVKGSPWDNACIESFHALIKREWLWRFKIKDFRHAYKLIFEYIDAFYNTTRIHSHCGYMSPDAYEKKYYDSLKQASKEVA